MAALWAGKIGLPSPFIISSFMLEYIRLVTWGAEISLVIFVVRGKTILKASREINVLHQSSYLTPATCSTYLLVTPYIVVVVLEGKIHFMFVVHYCHGLTAHLATIQTVGRHSKTLERVKHHKTLKLKSE